MIKNNLNKKFRLHCCGSRGSRPMEGRRFNEFGGYTSCYVLKCGEYALVIDCGTGLYAAPGLIADCTKVDVLLTHMHYDHTLGLLDWKALPKGADITFYSDFDSWFGKDSFKEFFRYPFWPVQPDFHIEQIPGHGIPMNLRDDLTVTFYRSNHPDNSNVFSIELNSDGQANKFLVLFDTNRPEDIPEDVLQNCDLILYDGTYTEGEYIGREDWGHSTWQEGIRLAKRVNPGRIIITHHEPDRTDGDLRLFEKKAREEFENCDFARAGQVWNFPYIRPETPKQEAAGDRKSKGISSIEKFLLKLRDSAVDERKAAELSGYVCYTVLGTVSLFMTFVNMATDKHLLMLSTAVFAFLCFIDVILSAAMKIKSEYVISLFQLEILLLFGFFVITGEPEGFAIVWSLMLPIAGMGVFGRKRTTRLCIVFFVFLVFVFYTSYGRAMLRYDYTESYLLRFPIAFVAFFALGFVLETLRSHMAEELAQLRREQADIIAEQTSELRDQNWELSKLNASLALKNRQSER